MMKMKKHMVLLLVGLMLCAALSGCNASGPMQTTDMQAVEPPAETVQLYLLTEIIGRNQQGEVISKETFTWDDRGLLLSATLQDGGEYRYTYDSYGHITSEIYISVNGEQNAAEYTYTYDEKGTLLTYSGSLNNGRYAIPLQIFSYDEQGRLVKSVAERADGTPYDVYRCDYDSEGRLIKVYHESTNGAVVEWGIACSEYSFPASILQTVYMNGQIVSSTEEYWDSQSSDQVSYRDRENNKKASMRYQNGVLCYYSQENRDFELDENGNIVKMIYYGHEGTYTYEFKYQSVTLSTADAKVWRPLFNEYTNFSDFSRHIDYIINFILPHDDVGKYMQLP